ncbi:tetratricopeptide (TPR) repeat protein [Desmospora profundinema]|uniref:Tetratricopeptide (TPR) repeat protein n=1 Tax=Desmospora profundinema TaxID=1571184 RepID=A0ABU1IHC9_9BACL|nr:tetratricopeptide (TPR) repeat protein [Desmospora profundinema]
MEDLADDNISPATISNVERGVPHVSMDKAMYLLDKLKIETRQIPHLLMEEENELKRIQLKLESIESLWRFKQYDKALQKIKDLSLDDAHPFAATAAYLQGKCLIDKGKPKQAERALYNAIKLANQHAYNRETNVEAASFCELSICAYNENNLDTALQFTNSALGAFHDNGERQHLRYALLRNKAVFLDKLGNVNAGMRVIEEVWDSLDKTENVDTRITFHWLRSEFLRKTGEINEAFKYAKQGLALAVANNHSKYIFDFWTILGCLHTAQSELDKAESCFDTALSGKDTLSDQRTLSITFAKLGVLYIHQQKYPEAKEAITQAVQHAKKQNDLSQLTYALMVMGDLLKKNEEVKEAIQYYQRALELAQKHALKRREYKLLLKLAECWHPIDEKEFQKCMMNIYQVKKELKDKEGDFFDEMD